MKDMSPEALLIVNKLKGGKGKPDDAEEEKEDSGDVSAEAVTASCESVFKALRGREGSEEEVKALEEALDDWFTAKGY